MESNRPVGEGKITFSAMKPSRTSEPELKKVKGSSSSRFQQSTIGSIFATYPLKLIVPEHASSSTCQWLYAITYGGGLVENDDIRLNVCVEEGCCVLITTQSSTKIYHCQDGGLTKQHMDVTVEKDGLVAIIPDPLLPYKDANYKQTQVVRMTSSSNVILLDWYSAGRVARGEIWEFSKLETTNKVIVDNEPQFIDSVSLCGSPYLELKKAMKTYQTLGCLVVLGQNLETLSAEMLRKYGKPKDFESKYTNSSFFAVSPIKFKCSNIQVNGCVLKFGADSPGKIYSELDSLLRPLYSTLGGDPFSQKY